MLSFGSPSDRGIDFELAIDRLPALCGPFESSSDSADSAELERDGFRLCCLLVACSAAAFWFLPDPLGRPRDLLLGLSDPVAVDEGRLGPPRLDPVGPDSSSASFSVVRTGFLGDTIDARRLAGTSAITSRMSESESESGAAPGLVLPLVLTIGEAKEVDWLSRARLCSVMRVALAIICSVGSSMASKSSDSESEVSAM